MRYRVTSQGGNTFEVKAASVLAAVVESIRNGTFTLSITKIELIEEEKEEAGEE